MVDLIQYGDSVLTSIKVKILVVVHGNINKIGMSMDNLTQLMKIKKFTIWTLVFVFFNFCPF